MRKFFLAAIFVFSMSAGLATEKPVIKACHENENSYPWILKDRPGLTILMLQMVEKQTGSKIEITALPWARCMDSVKRGVVDAAFKISYSPARAAELGNYPMVGDQPDASQRMFNDGYSLYRLRGTSVGWDGKTLQVKGSVGAQAGFSVVEQLKALGIQVDNGSRSPDDNLKKLILGRFDAVALQTNESDMRIQSNPEFKAKIEKISPVLVEKPYFFIFSKQFTSKYPEHVKEVWGAIARVRDSTEYAAVVKNFH